VRGRGLAGRDDRDYADFLHFVGLTIEAAGLRREGGEYLAEAERMWVRLGLRHPSAGAGADTPDL
jgi:hypothetical protein